MSILKRVVAIPACAVAVLWALLGTHPACAYTYWTEWTSINMPQDYWAFPGEASGTIGDKIDVTYNGEIWAFYSQTSSGNQKCWLDYWEGDPIDPDVWTPSSTFTSGVVENAPPGKGSIWLAGTPPGETPRTNVITFSSPVTNPIMAIVSVGGWDANGNDVPAEFHFLDDFTILSTGPDFWGWGTLTRPAPNILKGIEGSGTIQFLGTFSSISWTNPLIEASYGFTIGINALPEPSTVALLAIGVVGLAGVRRKIRFPAFGRKRKKGEHRRN